MTTITELRHSHRLEEAYAAARENFDEAPGDIWHKRPMAWVLHDYLKQYRQYSDRDKFKQYFNELLTLELPGDEDILNNAVAWHLVNIWFDTARQSSLDHSFVRELTDIAMHLFHDRPSEVHSALLSAMLKCKMLGSDFLDFMDKWGLENFNSADYQTSEFNGKNVMSVVEQAHIAYSKSLLAGKADPNSPNPFEPIRLIDGEKIRVYLVILGDLIRKHPEYEYLPYFKAKLMLAVGENHQDILQSVLPFARNKQREYWVWQQLASLFPDDRERQIACLCQGLSCGAQDAFLVKLRVELARLLVDVKKYTEAKTEILAYIRTSEQQGWRVKNQIKVMQQELWYSTIEPHRDNLTFYASYRALSEQVLYLDIEPVVGVAYHINEPKGVVYFVVDKKVHGNFKMIDFDIEVRVGDTLEMHLIEKKGKEGQYYKVVSAQRTGRAPSNSVHKIVSGNLVTKTDRNGQLYGFLEDIFVAPDLLAGCDLKSGVMETAEAHFVRSYNTQKQEWGWKAIHVNLKKNDQ